MEKARVLADSEREGDSRYIKEHIDMEPWQFAPWALQYVVGGVFSLAVSLYVVSKSRETKTCWIFFAFGLSIAAWLFFIFLHRIAPTPELSKWFFRFGLFFVTIAHPLLLFLILYLRKKRGLWILSVLPAFVVAFVGAIRAPFDIVWASPALGWSYKFSPYFGRFYTPFQIGYMIVVVLAAIFLILKTRTRILRKKYAIILFSYLIFYCAGMAVTQSLIQSNPTFPPIAGILLTLEFLFIAYALALPTERIIPFQSLDKLAQAYLDFLRIFQDKIPGRELGESSFRFDEYIEAMGLTNAIAPGSGELVFDADGLRNMDIGQLPDTILRTVKEYDWARETVNAFSNVFVMTYQTLSLKSKEAADEWFEQILKRHGTFLAEQGILAAMPKQVKIPKILKKLQSGRTYLFQEEKPGEAYQLLKEALGYGFASLCISKLHPGKVKERYDVGEDSILWLTFEKGERTISPKDIGKLNKTVSEFLEGTRSGIVLLDCLDQVKFANGFHKSLAVLKDLSNLCSENDSIVLISVNPEMFKKQELQAIQKELKGMRI